MRKSNFESFIRFGGSRALVQKPFGSPHLERKQDSQEAEGAVVEWILDVWSNHYGAVVQSILKTTPFEFSPAKLAYLDQASLRVDAEMVVLAAMEAEGFDLSSAEGERRAVMVLTNFLNQALQKAMGIRFYVWTTHHDTRVRDSHAERDGKIFRWDSPPESGHPAEDFGCRCYAHPLGIEGYWERVSEGVIAYKALALEPEENVDHMYLDSKSNVTVGIGTFLPNAAAAAALAFRRNVTEDLASEDQKTTEYDLLDAMTNDGNFTAAHYAQFTNLHLRWDEKKRLVGDHMREIFDALLGLFPYFGNYPQSVQIALWDMAYNLGVDGLSGKFPNFCLSIQDEDWATAALESHRTGIGEERNDHIRDLFLEAADEAAAAEEGNSADSEGE